MPAIPEIFINDVASKDTNIFSKVVIHTEDELNFNLYFSTNKLTFKGVGLDSNKTVSWKPLLLKIPSIKEKYDIDTKKMVSSRLTLSFSNAHYEDSRMSDVLSQIGLIEKKVTIYYQTQSAKNNEECLQVFYGSVKRVKHDSKTLKLELHDLGSGLHKELPQTYLDNATGYSVGKPVPINYGWQEYAPAIVERAGTYYKLHFDTCLANGIVTDDPFETSGKTTSTQNYMGFADKIGWKNTLSTWQATSFLFVNGKYGMISQSTFGNTYNVDNMGVIENNMTEEQSDDIKPYDTQVNTFSVYNNPEPWNEDEETYFKLFKTKLLKSQNCLGVSFVDKSDNIKFNVVDPGPGVQYPPGMAEYQGVGAEELASRAADGQYWGNTAFSWNAGTIPHFYTSNEDGDDIPSEMRQISGDNQFWRVKVAEIIIGTEPDVGEKRIQATTVYINGLKQYTNNSANDFVDYNDRIEGQNYFDTGFITTNENGNTGIVNSPSVGGGTSIAIAPDRGHDSSESYYPRETYAMNYNWIANSNSYNVNPDVDGDGVGDNIALSMLDGGAYHFMPAFQYTAGPVGTGFTIGSVRFYAGAAVHKEYRIEWYQDFWTGFSSGLSQEGKIVNNTHFKAQIRQVDIVNSVHMEDPFTYPMAVNIEGRIYDGYEQHKGTWSEGKFLQNPADIIRHLVEYELGFYEFDEEDYALAFNEHASWKFSCGVKDVIDSKALIEDISQYTKMFPKFGTDGKFRFNTIKHNYNENDYNNAISIDYTDLVDYKFELSKVEDVVSKIDLHYRWDHYNETCAKKWSDVIAFGLVSNGNWHSGGPPPSGMVHAHYRGPSNGGYVSEYLPEHNDAELKFYNRDDVEDYTKKLECKYVQDFTNTSDLGSNGICQGPGTGGDEYFNYFSNYTAYKVYDAYWYQHKNNHLIMTLKLPVKYVYIDVGQVLKFDKLFNDLLAYGINYTKLQIINNQYRYPLFFVTGVNKNVNSIEVTCMQLHYLGETSNMLDVDFWNTVGYEPPVLSFIHPPFVPETEETEQAEPVYGCTDPMANNYNPSATSNDNSCVYPFYGCTDPNAANYNPNADTDDGSCSFQHGCTDPAAINYTENAVIDDGSCQYDWGDTSPVQFGGVNQEATGNIENNQDYEPGSMFFHSNTQTFLFKDFTKDGTFGYGDFAGVDEAYTKFYGIALPVGQEEDGTPNAAFNYIFNFNKWKRNGEYATSWQDLLFRDVSASSINSSIYPHGQSLITIKIGHQESLWNDTNKLFCDLSNINPNSLGGFFLNYYNEQLENGGLHLYFQPWYGVYEWKLCIYWPQEDLIDEADNAEQFGGSGYNFTLEWKLETIEQATNYFNHYYSDWVGDTLNVFMRGIIVSNSNSYNDYIDEFGQSMQDYLGLDAWQGMVLNSQWQSDDDLVESAPILVDKCTYGVIPQHPYMEFYEPFGAVGWEQNNLDFAASEIKITVHQNFIDQAPNINSGDNYITYEAIFDTEKLQQGTVLYEPPLEVVIGDVNFDDSIDIIDVVSLVNIALGNIEFTEEMYLASDFNQDGSVNVFDIVTLVNYILDNE